MRLITVLEEGEQGAFLSLLFAPFEDDLSLLSAYRRLRFASPAVKLVGPLRGPG